MTSTGNYRDQVPRSSLCQLRRSKTVKALEDDHGKLELYSLPDREPIFQDNILMAREKWESYRVVLNSRLAFLTRV